MLYSDLLPKYNHTRQAIDIIPTIQIITRVHKLNANTPDRSETN